MEFDDGFAVRAPIDEVWATLLDVERVAPCMPGAEVLERLGDDAYAVAVRVRVGPIAMRYRGEVEIAERDPDAHRAVLRARAREARGQGTAAATIEMRLAQDGGDATAARLHTDLQMSGRAAAMGRGVIQDVAARLVARFADNLAAMLEGAPAEAAGGGGAATAPGPEGGAAAAGAGAAAGSGAGETAGGGGGAAGAGAGDAAPRGGDGAAAADAVPRPADALPLGEVAASVVAGRLRDPRVAGALALLCVLLGYALGRARR